MRTKASLILAVIFCMIFSAFLFAGDKVSSAERIPGVRMLKSISDQYQGVKFDHQKHTSIAENCGTCHHHGNGASALCKECHGLTASAFKNSVVNNFMACSNCHGSFDRDNPGMPGLKVAYHKKCFECHRGMGNIGTDPKGCAEMCHEKKIKKGA